MNRRGMPVFDTHKAVKALCRSGFTDSQAEAVVEQINGAVNENVATKQDLRDAVAPLATKEELRDAVALLATKEELRVAVAPLATKEELRAAVAPLATKEELAQLEVRLMDRMDNLAGKMLRYMGGGLALVVALIKGLELLSG